MLGGSTVSTHTQFQVWNSLTLAWLSAEKYSMIVSDATNACLRDSQVCPHQLFRSSFLHWLSTSVERRLRMIMDSHLHSTAGLISCNPVTHTSNSYSDRCSLWRHLLPGSVTHVCDDSCNNRQHHCLTLLIHRHAGHLTVLTCNHSTLSPVWHLMVLTCMTLSPVRHLTVLICNHSSPSPVWHVTVLTCNHSTLSPVCMTRDGAHL